MISLADNQPNRPASLRAVWDVRVCMQLTDGVDSFLSTVVEDSFIRKMHTLFALQRERSSPRRGA